MDGIADRSASVSERQTIPAVIAAHRGLDETRALGVSADQREDPVADVETPRLTGRTGRRGLRTVTVDGIAHHLSKLRLRDLHRHPPDRRCQSPPRPPA